MSRTALAFISGSMTDWETDWPGWPCATGARFDTESSECVLKEKLVLYMQPAPQNRHALPAVLAAGDNQRAATTMTKLHHSLVALATLVVQVLAQSCPTINPANAPTFASGYSGRVVMNGLRQPRGLIFDNQGNMLTTEQGGYGVRYIQLTDNGGINVCVKSNKQLIQDSSVSVPFRLLHSSVSLRDRYLLVFPSHMLHVGARNPASCHLTSS